MQENTAKIICFSNHKGGVGKTCSTCNVGAGLARLGKKVLLIDLDPQANLSLSLGIKDEEQRNIYHVLLGDYALSDMVMSIRENLDLVPSNLDLAGAEVELASEAGREMILRETIEPLVNRYDYILIDCAPSLGLLTINALTASTEVFIPLQPHNLALLGIQKLEKVIEKIRRRLNKSLCIGGVFITLFDKRTVLNRGVGDAIEAIFQGRLFNTRIRNNIALAEAPGKGQDIFRYNPKSNGALDYEALCMEIVTRHQEQQRSETTAGSTAEHPDGEESITIEDQEAEMEAVCQTSGR